MDGFLELLDLFHVVFRQHQAARILDQQPMGARRLQLRARMDGRGVILRRGARHGCTRCLFASATAARCRSRLDSPMRRARPLMTLAERPVMRSISAIGAFTS
ncbi:hypothetical protein D3C87_1798810 [compost metagenome]